MRPAAPVAHAQRRAIAGQSAQGRGRANRAAGIGADARQRRALLDSRRRSARRPARQQRCILRLQAIAVVAILAGNAIGQLMQVRLAGDHRARRLEPRCDPRVRRRRRRASGIEARAAAGHESFEIETILERDRKAEESAAARPLDQPSRLVSRPLRIQRDVGVPAGIPIGAGQCGRCDGLKLRAAIGNLVQQLRNRRGSRFHAAIVTAGEAKTTDWKSPRSC